jgi:hypothetical protein
METKEECLVVRLLYYLYQIGRKRNAQLTLRPIRALFKVLVRIYNITAKHTHAQHELPNAEASKTTSDPSFAVEVDRWPVR